MAMALTLLSQATNGTTYEELRKVLHLNNDRAVVANQSHEYIELIEKSAGQSELMIANHIYIQKEFQLNTNFQKIAVNKFHTGVESVDFRKKNETIELINSFVEEKTNGKIKEIVTAEKITPLTRVFLVNSIYLNSTWAQPFPLRGTRRDKFYISETETVDVEYIGMKKSVWHTDVNELNAEALGLDYANSNFTFIIILPNRRTGLSALEAQLPNIDLSEIVDQMRDHEHRIKIPKFKIQSEFHMNDILKKMGMKEMFGKNADLSIISNSKEPLHMSHVVHKATIEINEKLTEDTAASGSTSITLGGTGSFLAEHPFMYFVWDRETKTTIFSGSIKHFD